MQLLRVALIGVPSALNVLNLAQNTGISWHRIQASG